MKTRKAWKPVPCMHNQIAQLCPHCEQPQHTPTPWKINQAGENIYLYIDVPSEHWPTHDVIANMDGEDYLKDKANIEFILKACNNFTPMLELLKECRAFQHLLAGDADPDLTKKLDTLLAKLEGGK